MHFIWALVLWHTQFILFIFAFMLISCFSNQTDIPFSLVPAFFLLTKRWINYSFFMSFGGRCREKIEIGNINHKDVCFLTPNYRSFYPWWIKLFFLFPCENYFSAFVKKLILRIKGTRFLEVYTMLWLHFKWYLFQVLFFFKKNGTLSFG